jgi:hypothetical protein
MERAEDSASEHSTTQRRARIDQAEDRLGRAVDSFAILGRSITETHDVVPRRHLHPSVEADGARRRRGEHDAQPGKLLDLSASQSQQSLQSSHGDSSRRQRQRQEEAVRRRGGGAAANIYRRL